eukprot:354988-Chlamydomonas_euryale.AAC.23
MHTWVKKRFGACRWTGVVYQLARYLRDMFCNGDVGYTTVDAAAFAVTRPRQVWWTARARPGA